MNLEYFISSLPMLAYGQPSPITEKAFREACATGLDGKLASSVKVLLDSFDGAKPKEDVSSPWVSAWLEKDFQIRSVVARRRAARLGLQGREFPAVVTDTRIEPAVNAAFDEINPLRREEAIDRLRWQLADEMQGYQPISENVVLAYAVKLKLILRFQSLNPELGKTKFSELTK